MTIRVYDDEGTPYEQTIDVRETVHRTEIPYNNTRRAKQRRKDAHALSNGDLPIPVPAEDVQISLGDVLSSEEEIKQWKLEDWSSEDEEKMALEAFEWIRIDADVEWICDINLGTPEWMYAAQLRQDRDVIAQYEVFRSLVHVANLVHQILFRNAGVENNFHHHDSNAHGSAVLLWNTAGSSIRPGKSITPRSLVPDFEVRDGKIRLDWRVPSAKSLSAVLLLSDVYYAA